MVAGVARLTIRAQVAPEVPKVTDGNRNRRFTGVKVMKGLAMHPELRMLVRGQASALMKAHEAKSGVRHGGGRLSTLNGSQSIRVLLRSRALISSMRCLPNLQWSSHTHIRETFSVVMMQKLPSEYYVASDCGVEHFSFKISLEERSCPL